MNTLRYFRLIVVLSFICISLGLPLDAQAQDPTVVFFDDFTDGELDNNPIWTYSTTAWSIIDGRLHHDGLITDSSDRYRTVFDSTFIPSIQATDYLEMSFFGLLKSIGNPQVGRGIELHLVGQGGAYMLRIQKSQTSSANIDFYSFALSYTTNSGWIDLIVSDFEPEYDQGYEIKAIRQNGVWTLYVDSQVIGSTPDPLGMTQLDRYFNDVIGSVIIDDVTLKTVPCGPPSDPTCEFEQHVISDHIPNSRAVFVTDIDNDADQDLIGSDRQNNKLYLYENDGNQGFSEHVIDNIDAYWIHGADMDADGDQDLAVVGFAIYGYEAYWYENQGSMIFTRHFLDHYGVDPSFIHVIDLDGDSDLDMLANANGWNRAHLYWYENDGSENFTEHEIFDLYAPLNGGCQSSAPVDMDMDGDLDLVEACDSSPVFWLENNGNESFTRHNISSTFSYTPYNVQATDLDGDGDIDVLVPDIMVGTFWLENDGSQNFSQHQVSFDRAIVTSVWATDLDDDGDLDIVEADHGSNQVRLLVNQGDMSFAPETVACNLGGVLAVVVVDLDQDGNADIIIDEANSGILSWFEQKVVDHPPEITSVSASVDPIQIGQNTTVTATFNDPDIGDAHTALWDWGDGTTSTMSAEPPTISAVHDYAAPGVYTVTVTVIDVAGASDTDFLQYIVVYDPNGGFVTGGGWIHSPAGAFTADPTLTGKATFGFVSKYQRGANVPTGNTEFQFKIANLNFKSSSYDWLVVAGTKAQYKGTGTINGMGTYKFMLTAIDGAPDKFRIKIWDAATGDVIYDNQLGASDTDDPTTVIQGGSIVIHRAR